MRCHVEFVEVTMSANCCGPAEKTAVDPRWRRALWIALIVNAGMFVAELAAGEIADSRSLQADALDFFGDAANYAISLGVAGLALAWRARAALFKGVTLAALGGYVMVGALLAATGGASPQPQIMGAVGIAALVANVAVALMLYRFREGDANMRSAWICSRNDAIANIAVVGAAVGVFGTGTAWPDLIVAAIMATLGIQRRSEDHSAGLGRDTRQPTSRAGASVNEMTFTPALGRPGFNAAYDLAIRVLTREQVWRTALLNQVRPRDSDFIIDVGCGTGTFAMMLKRAAPRARIVGLDPDPSILAIAAAKAEASGVQIEWRQGFAHEAADQGELFDKVISSLMFHQVPIAQKRSGMAAMAAAVRAGGEVHIADYARQPSGMMRHMFGLVQRMDGYEDTQPNADGILESLIAEINAKAGQATRIIYTPTGAISLFQLAPQP